MFSKALQAQICLLLASNDFKKSAQIGVQGRAGEAAKSEEGFVFLGPIRSYQSFTKFAACTWVEAVVHLMCFAMKCLSCF